MNFYMNFDAMILTFYTWHGSVWYIVGIYQDKCLETYSLPGHKNMIFINFCQSTQPFIKALLSYPLIKLIGLCLAHSLELSANQIASQNLLRLRRKARYARLLPPADSRDFGIRARFSSRLPRSLFVSIAQNRVFDKDYIAPNKLMVIWDSTILNLLRFTTLVQD